LSIKNKLKSFFSVDEEYEYNEEVYSVEESNQEKENGFSRKPVPNNVVRLESVQSTSKVVLLEPKDFEGVQEIAEHLKSRKAVVINLQRAEHNEAKRIVDFLSGCTYALGGNIQKLSKQTFLFAPDNMDITGSISELDEM
jgi:cell division inhibitor SepF